MSAGELPLEEPKAAPKMTEADVLALLREHHNKPGNGGSGEYAFVAHVRNDAGFSSTRTFDAIAMSLWPSRGLTLHVFEVKVSRSDWQRELKDPAKAEAACRLGDYFSIVAPKGVVQRNELPPTWGLLEVIADGTRLRTTVAAPFLRESVKNLPAVPRGLVVSLLRAAGAVPEKEPRALREARAVGFEEGKQCGADMVERWREEAERLRGHLAEFERLTGINLHHRYDADGDRLREVADAVKRVLDGDRHADRVAERVATAHRLLLDAAESLTPFLTPVSVPYTGNEKPQP